MNEKIQCALYVRVSSQNQLDTEYNSMETQKEKLEAYCKSQEGYEVYQVYEDGAFSADSLQRPALQRMLVDIQAGKIQCVIAYKIDRLTRSVKDFHSLMEVFDHYKVRFISTTQAIDTSSPTGRLMRNILLDFAQFEREMTADRTRDKMYQRANKGMWNGGVIPFGYKSENKKLVKHPEEAEIVQFMFQQFYQEPSLTKLRDKLTARGSKTRFGKPWNKTGIDGIIRNPVYCGMIRFTDKLSKGEHEGLVEESLFQAVQSCRRDTSHTQTRTKNQRPYLLKGLLKCSDCGSFMTPHYTQKKRKDGTPHFIAYYRCTKTMNENNRVCKVKSLNADQVEKVVIQYLGELANNETYLKTTIDDLNQNIEKQMGPLIDEANRLKKHLDEIEREITTYVRAFGRAGLSLERLDKEVGRLEEEKKGIQKRFDEINQKINNRTVSKFNVELVKEGLTTFERCFGSLAPQEQSEALQCILKDVLVSPDKLTLAVFEMAPFALGSQKDLKWLPGLDSNQQPCD